MNTYKKAIIIGIVLLFVLSCSTVSLSKPTPTPTPDLKKAIIGKWESVGNDKYIEFKGDGTLSVSIGSIQGGGFIMADGTYSFISKDTITLTITNPIMGTVSSTTITVGISGVQLIIKGTSGSPVTYSRLH